ncbi:MAG TPA: hypothetical protein VIM25_01885, partial [Candidatus Limnocylindrales bacterium]
MLDTALLSALTALTVTTVALLVAGRLRWGGRVVRLAPLVVVLLLAVLEAPPEMNIVVAAIALIGTFLPRRWYAVGAWF